MNFAPQDLKLRWLFGATCYSRYLSTLPVLSSLIALCVLDLRDSLILGWGKSLKYPSLVVDIVFELLNNQIDTAHLLYKDNKYTLTSDGQITCSFHISVPSFSTFGDHDQIW